MTENTFPCIICGKPLRRVMPMTPAQPANGVMCSTHGNYGSTVFDDLDGERLHFNICDACLTTAGEQGRIVVAQHYQNLTAPIGPGGMPSIVGIEKFADRTFEPWDPHAPEDEVPVRHRAITLAELENPPANWDLHIPVAELRKLLAAKN